MNKKMHRSGEDGRFEVDNQSSPPSDFGRSSPETNEQERSI